MRLATITIHICTRCENLIQEGTLYYEYGDDNYVCNICLDTADLYTDEMYLVNKFEDLKHENNKLTLDLVEENLKILIRNGITQDTMKVLAKVSSYTNKLDGEIRDILARIYGAH